VYASFLFMRIIWLFMLTCRNLSVNSPLGGMLVKSPLYGDVSEKPMMGMFYPYSVGILTCVKSIVTMCECACATVPERFALADSFFSFGEDE
jgi:hypothetical protein